MTTILRLSLLTLLTLPGLALAALDIGQRRELFVDDYLVDRLAGTTMRLHHPHYVAPAIPFNDPWDRDASGYATVIVDDGLYRMYYRGGPRDMSAGKSEGSTSYFCYAESTDGINWVKPTVGLVEFEGSKENNILLAPAPREDPWTQSISPFLDNRPGVPADERYKAVGGQWPQGLYVLVSPDGLRWKKWREEPVFKNGAFDSLNVAFWSEHEQCYVLYFRTFTGWTDYSAKSWGLSGYRTISRTTSKDLINWTDPVRMSFGNTPLEHLYTNGTRPYFRAPHIYMATPMRFVPGRRFLTDEEMDAQQLGKGFRAISGPTHSIPNEVSDTVFMTSRGGSRYDRTFMEAFVRPGLDKGNWVSRNGVPATGFVQTSPTEMSLYVGQNYVQPTAHLGRYTLRLDGIGSIHADYTGGEMVTKPLTFTGSKLTLNVSTSAAGGVQVEIQEADGEPIPGFTLEECPVLVGDSLEREVKWTMGGDVSALAGKSVRLRFVLKDADLYALKFAE
ncbi:MAG: hypothetical protein H7A44_07985 [Opitutaceae bacterium]|nr:hypothetical protein [Cephaloticoccus sp.]MCP5530368.1 hypothetical protein [Opitutaceae bacterium]